MKFTNKLERMEHPQARLIPESIWNSIFGGTLAESIIPLLRVKQEELVELLAQKNIPSYTYPAKQQLWVLIALNYPELRLDELDKIGKSLLLSEGQRFILGAAIGNAAYLRYLVEQVPAARLQDLLSYSNFEAFTVAACHDQLDVLYYLEEVLSHLKELVSAHTLETLTAVYYAKVFVEAVRNGRLDVLRHLKKPPTMVMLMFCTIWKKRPPKKPCKR